MALLSPISTNTNLKRTEKKAFMRLSRGGILTKINPLAGNAAGPTHRSNLHAADPHHRT